MAKYIEASLYHVASTADNPQHHLCPEGEDSWCGYKETKRNISIRMEFQAALLSLSNNIYGSK